MTAVAEAPSREEGPATPPQHRNRVTLGAIGRVGTLVVTAAIFLFLLVTFILAAFRTRQSMSSANPVSGLSWSNLRYDWEQIRGFDSGLFTTWYKNSLIVCLGGTALSLLSSIPSGYALAKLRFPFRRTLLIVTILMMVIPNTVLVIPLFLEVDKIHQLGQLWPVAVIFGFFPFGTYMAYIHFETALPTELVEAARVDGLGEDRHLRTSGASSFEAGRRDRCILLVPSKLDELLPAACAAPSRQSTDSHSRLAAADHRESAVRPVRCSGLTSAALHAATRIRCGTADGAVAQ